MKGGEGVPRCMTNVIHSALFFNLSHRILFLTPSILVQAFVSTTQLVYREMNDSEWMSEGLAKLGLVEWPEMLLHHLPAFDTA